MNEQYIPNPVIPSESVSELIGKALLTELERMKNDADLCSLSVTDKEKHIAHFLKETPGYTAIPAVCKGKIWGSIKSLAPDIYRAHYLKAHPENPKNLKPKKQSMPHLAAAPVERTSEEQRWIDRHNAAKETLKGIETYGKICGFMH